MELPTTKTTPDPAPELIHAFNVNWTKDIHFIDHFRHSLESTIGRPINKGPLRPHFVLSDEEKAMNPLVNGPYWVIAAGYKWDATVKGYRQEDWQAVVDHYGESIQFVQVGGVGNQHAEQHLTGTVDLTGKTSVRELIRLIASTHCVGVVSAITAPMHIGAAFGKPLVTLAGAREKDWVARYPDSEWIRTSCQNQGCWKLRAVPFESKNLPIAIADPYPQFNGSLCTFPDGDHASCMTAITPERVIQGIERFRRVMRQVSKVSFCIITNGRRFAVTRAAILAINHAARLDGITHEVIVCGDAAIFARLPHVRVVDHFDAAATARLGAMRNRAVKHARGEWMVLLDDDCFVPESFVTMLQAYIAAKPEARIVDTFVYDTHDSLMHDRRPYLIGGFMAAHRSIFDEIIRDDSIVSHTPGVEDEDQEYSRRLREGGYTIHFDHLNWIWHWNGDHTRKDHSPRFINALDQWERQTKRCILVLGTESSGSRLWTEHLLACDYDGSTSHDQPFDHSLEGAGNKIAYRVSFPMGDDFRDMTRLLQYLGENGYRDVACYWTQRDDACLIQSMLKAGHAASEAEAIADIERGRELIAAAVKEHNLPCQIVHYERLISEPDYRHKLLAAFDLVPIGQLPVLRDENAKWMTKTVETADLIEN